MIRTSRSRTRRVLLAVIALLGVGSGGLATTAAYFTATQELENNAITAATVTLGPVGADGNETAPVTFDNIIPLSPKTVSVTVRNTGSVAVDWVAVLEPADTVVAAKFQIQHSLDNGTTWSTAGNAGTLANTSVASSAALRPGGTTTVLLRLVVPDNGDNSAQGQTLKFLLKASAVQAGAPRS
jgi:hypothetical protein